MKVAAFTFYVSSKGSVWYGACGVGWGGVGKGWEVVVVGISTVVA